MDSSNENTGYSYQSMSIGSKVAKKYVVDNGKVAAFASLFGDKNPVHCDDEYARKYGFEKRIVHGAYLNGLLSEFIGMTFPAGRALLLSAELNYKLPVYSDDTIEIEATVFHKTDSYRVLVLNVDFYSTNREEIVSNGVVKVKILDNKQ